MSTICNSCGDRLEGTCYEVTYRDASVDEENNELQEERKKKNLSQEEEKEKPVDKIARAEELEKRLDEILESLKKSGNTDHDEELENLRATLHDLMEELKNDDDEVKKSRNASLETIGVESYHNKICGDDLISGKIKRRYSVLKYNNSSEENGDSLLIKMGSVN